MKIGYIYSRYYPVTTSHSVHGHCLMQALKSRGHEILSCRGDGNPDCRNFSPSKWGAVHLARAADVLYIRASTLSNLTCASLLKYVRPFALPVVWEVNAPIEELRSTMPPGRELERCLRFERRKLRLLARFADAGIGVSDSLQSYIRSELGIERAYTIPNGSLPAAYEPHNIKKTCLERFPGTFKVCWAGDARISWQGVDLIVETARLMEKTDPEVLFILLAGESAQPLPVLTNLLVLQQVPFPDLPHYLAMADACLCLYHEHASGFYNSPLKCFDYMAAGKPLIASPLGQLRQVIRHGDNGLHAQSSPEEICRQLRQLKNDPELCRRLGERARQDSLSYYNWDRVARETEAVFLEAIAAKTGQVKVTRP